MSKMRSNSLTKICKVCGDKALGHNFNVVTCESCKAFFRRNASKEKALKCPFEGNCLIDVVTRRFCQSCRLRKCFEMGMKKEWILTDEEKQKKRAKIEENKLKKSSSSNNSCPDSVSSKMSGYSTDESLSTLEYSPHEYHSGQQTISTNMSNNFTTTSLTSSSPDYSTASSPADTSEEEYNTYQSIVEAEFAQHQLNDPNWSTQMTQTNQIKTSGLQLNQLELAKLEELIVANDIVKQPLEMELSLPDNIANLEDIVVMTNHAVQRIVQMCKQLEGFKRLDQSDQIALLKGCCTEIMVLRSAMHYNLEKDAWQDSNEQLLVRLDILKHNCRAFYELHREIVMSFENWRKDEIVMILLCAIALFTPTRPNITYKEMIKLERYTYMHLLKRYLESTLDSYAEARTAYIQLIEKVDRLYTFNESHVRFYLQVDPAVVGPLLIELFDLKR